MEKANISIRKGKKGIVLKVETTPNISKTGTEDLNDCQSFVLELLNAGSQFGIWKALNVEKIEGNLKPKLVGARIIDLELDKLHGVNSKKSR